MKIIFCAHLFANEETVVTTAMPKYKKMYYKYFIAITKCIIGQPEWNEVVQGRTMIRCQ